ncbi:MAG: hypothetical protein C4B59_16520 [Candidatus Methanogaster sp.]|uniref:Uncharacterized protein n=1 Tax=Candidatus Methanogaster sp. TaxID=3386292 RepID=A0AC61KY52_9EURY|nr:MAG: hypothetical protein C4B59_16520 [ANME-2 cluster archaeon]
MVDMDVLLQTIVASGAVAGALSLVFKVYTEKRIDHVFDRKLKEYEAKLQESTELRVNFGKNRIEQYAKLSALVLSVRKKAVDLCEMPTPTEKEISELNKEAKNLQEMIYDLFTTLEMDHIYDTIHSYKENLITLVKNLKNEKIHRDNGATEKADEIRKNINGSIADIKEEYKSIGHELVELIHKEITIND